jgi:antitoxin MazE
MSAIAKAQFEGTIQPWGNSLGIRITRPVSKMSRLGQGDKVIIEVTDDGLLVRAKTKKKRVKLPYSESQLLQGMTPRKAHADELPTPLPSEMRL